MFNNYQNILDLKVKSILYYLIVTTFVLFIAYILNFKTYSTYYTKGFYQEKNIYIKALLGEENKISKGSKMIINNKRTKYKINEISDVMLDSDNLLNYQVYKLEVATKYKENEILDIKIYYDKEKIYKKLLNKII